MQELCRSAPNPSEPPRRSLVLEGSSRRDLSSSSTDSARYDAIPHRFGAWLLGRFGSRRQPMEGPAALRAQLVDQAIMQTARAPLPELDAVGGSPVAAPVVRERHVRSLPARFLGAK